MKRILCIPTWGLITMKCKKKGGMEFFSQEKNFIIILLFGWKKSDCKCPAENLIGNRNCSTEVFCDDSEEQ